ncbi:MAG: hypothetical protein Q8R96_11695 [Bacteroidota bacterium]|nr:hypothetical protein [Bacteroidota bacterium]
MPKAIYIIAAAIIAWILFSGKKAGAVIADSVLKNALIPESEGAPTTEAPATDRPPVITASPPVIEPVNPNPGATTQPVYTLPAAIAPVVVPPPVYTPPAVTAPIVGVSVVVPPAVTAPIVLPPVDNTPTIYTPPIPSELIRVKPYEGTEVFDTYSEGNLTRPVSEYYQKQINDKVLFAMYAIFDNHNYPTYKLVDAINESIATNKPVWLVVLLRAREQVETGKAEKIGGYINGANGAFGSISQVFRCNLTEKVVKANANIYLTRETNGLYIKAQYSAGANGVPLWREIYNLALKIANP